MELSDYRSQIDRIDAELLQLFAERMQTAAGIAAYKKSHGLPVLDAGREREKLAQIVKAAPEDLQEEAVSLYRLLFSLSRSYQRDLLDEKTALPALLKAALEQTPQLFPPQQPLPARALRVRIRSRPATSCSSIRAYSSARHLTRSSPPSSRACASTAFCRWKTARQARSTRCTTSCRSTISPSSAASACA